MDEELWNNLMLFMETKLGEAYEKNPEYRKALQKESEAYVRLSENFTEEQSSLFDEYFQMVIEAGNLREKIACFQGMKMVVSAMMHLMWDQPGTSRRQCRPQKRSRQKA